MIDIKVLVACEESQRVCTEFRKLGHEAYSCDIIDCSGGYPEWHIKQDVIPLLGGCFLTCDGKEHEVNRWDLIIAHPPCTFLTIAANKYYDEEKYGEKARERKKKREEAIEFFMEFVNADCDYIAVENPVGIMSTQYRNPDQYIQPYEFGDSARKKTGLWLKNLPLLQPTRIVDMGEIIGNGFSVGAHADGRNIDGKWLRYGDPELSKLRSKTFPGIAKAMAEQWGNITKLKGE